MQIGFGVEISLKTPTSKKPKDIDSILVKQIGGGRNRLRSVSNDRL
jgi:hypothetical protein